MESFLNKVEREANLEAERIRKEAQQVIAVLEALKLEIPKELRHIVSYTSVEVKPEEATEVKRERKKPDYSKRDTKRAAKVEAEYQQVRTEIHTALSKGPKLGQELFDELPHSKYRIQIAGRRMKQDGELDFRTRGFQGPSEWFLIERPVSLERLRDEVVKEKGDIPLEKLVDLGFTEVDHLLSMMDELVRQGIILKQDDVYKTLDPVASNGRKPRTFEEINRRGSTPVPGTGRTAKLSSDKQVQQDLAKAEKLGAQMKKQGNGHIEVSYKGDKRILASSPGDSGRSNREKLKDLGISV